MRAGLARIHPDENASAGMLARKISAQSASRGIQSGVVERSFAGFASNSIGAEELFRHVLVGLRKALSSLAHAEMEIVSEQCYAFVQ